jgi:PilZ domain
MRENGVNIMANIFSDQSTTARPERRRSNRFPLERTLKYRVVSRRAEITAEDGETLNISSTGVLFSTKHDLEPGKRVELSISWPAQLNDHCALKLVAKGRVVRSEPGQAALEIQKYEFRTAGSKGLA